MTMPRHRIGIFGGSFDPIHKGHIAIAKAALKSGEVDEVWLMVSPENPLKQGTRKASEDDRLRMAELSLSEEEEEMRSRIHLSDFEFHLPRPSYTIDTLRALEQQDSFTHYLWIIGGDNLSAIEKWVSPEEIIRDFGLLIYPRPGDDAEDLSKIGEKVVMLKDPALLSNCKILKPDRLYPHSSTSVRRLIVEGKEKEAQDAVGKRVMQYIKQHNLYKERI